MTKSTKKSNFWITLPGMLTGLAALITAIGGIYLGIHNRPNPSPSESPELPDSAEGVAEGEPLRVWASDAEGVPLPNKTGGYATVNFEATGTWLAIPEDEPDPRIPETAKGFISPEGDPNFEPNDMPCNQYPLGALVVRGEDGLCKEVGSEGTFELRPEETVYFLMNDVPTLYQDNDGYVDVSWSTSRSQ